MSKLQQQLTETFEALQNQSGGAATTLAERLSLLAFAVAARANDADTFPAVARLGLAMVAAEQKADGWRDQHTNLSPAERLQKAADALVVAYARIAQLEQSQGEPGNGVEVVDAATHDAAISELTTERDALRAKNEQLTARADELEEMVEALKANQATAEELARQQLARVGQPPVGTDAAGGQKDESKMTLTERAQAAIAAKQSGNRFRI